MNKLDDLINKQVGREIGSCEIDIEDIKTFADALVETIKDTIRKEYFVDKEGLVDAVPDNFFEGSAHQTPSLSREPPWVSPAMPLRLASDPMPWMNM